jgi:hypothetical protein
MPEATPRQISKFLRAKRHIDGPVKKAVRRAITISNFAKKVQAWSDSNDQGFQIWNDQQDADIEHLRDAYNRLTRVMAKVEIGKYGVRFVGNDFDIMAPPNITDDELALDKWQGFGLVVTIIVIGALVVSAIWGTSEIVRHYSDTKKTETAARIAEIDREMALRSGQPVTSWKQLKEQNKPELKEAGLFDKIFGSGSATTMMIVAGAAVVISILWRKK